MTKDIPNIKQSIIKSDVLYSLETSSQNIHIQPYVFWDWEDDVLSLIQDKLLYNYADKP